jgi:hypothetical protein
MSKRGVRVAKARPVVSRAEFQQLRETVDECCHLLDVQFKRIAQIQAELDHIKVASSKLSPPHSRT